MFTSGVTDAIPPGVRHAAYLTVPLSMEPALLRRLQITPYGTRARVIRSTSMELDPSAPVKRSRIPLPISY